MRFVLQGSVLASGNQLHINAQLANAQSGAGVGRRPSKAIVADLFTLQDQVTARHGRQIVVLRRAKAKPARAVKAADLILRANALALKPQSLQELEGRRSALLRQALVADPDNAIRDVGLATTLLLGTLIFGAVCLRKNKTADKLIAEAGRTRD